MRDGERQQVVLTSFSLTSSSLTSSSLTISALVLSSCCPELGSLCGACGRSDQVSLEETLGDTNVVAGKRCQS
eukprot:747448-Hanusia_phi.AAC.8